jgi:hypothetical protein
MKLVSTPNLDHQYQVVLADGLPDVPLTLFANDLLKSLSPASVPIYMRELLAAFDWAQSDEIVAGIAGACSGRLQKCGMCCGNISPSPQNVS